MKKIQYLKQYISEMKIVSQTGQLFYNPITHHKPYTREWVSRKFRKMLIENEIPKIRFHDIQKNSALGFSKYSNIL